MNNFAGQIFQRSRFPLAIVAGLLLAASFPKLSFAGLAWIAPAFLLAAAREKTGMAAFRIGYVGGLAYYLASLYWLLLIPESGFYPVLGWLALGLYLAVYPGIWVWLLAKTPDAESSWGQRTLWTLFGAAVWVALEMIVSRLFSGFPWNLLGTSQYQMLPLIQIASVVGVFGVSFLIVWVALALYSAALVLLRKPTMRYAWLSEIILPLAVVLAVFVYGSGRLRESDAHRSTIRVTCIQPSIPQADIWNPAARSNRFEQLMRLTEQALTNQTDLVIWPEAALPEFSEANFMVITNLIGTHRVWMIFGADDAELKAEPVGEDRYNFYNSAFLFNPEAKFAATYRKQNLVIFGEYIPLVKWLPFIKWFTPITGSFTAGDKPVPFELKGWSERPREPSAGATNSSPEVLPPRTIKTSTLICFEDVFPQLVPEYVEADTDFLVNLTNDGWFGESAEQWQHAAAGVFRAVENNVPLVRGCNNGLTCWIDSRGRLRKIFRTESGSEYRAGFMTAEIPLLAPGERRIQTTYNRYGDWFGWGCVAATGLVTLGRLWQARQSKRPKQ